MNMPVYIGTYLTGHNGVISRLLTYLGTRYLSTLPILGTLPYY